MDSIAPVLIPALAAVGGAGLTAIAGVLSSRERYSQRIERLGRVRESVADNILLRARLDRMIHHEISLASTAKATSFVFYLAIALILMGYLYSVLGVAYRLETDEPPVFDFSYPVIFWTSAGFLGLGTALLLVAIERRSRILRTTLPRAITGDEIAEFSRRQARIFREQSDAPSNDD